MRSGSCSKLQLCRSTQARNIVSRILRSIVSDPVVFASSAKFAAEAVKTKVAAQAKNFIVMDLPSSSLSGLGSYPDKIGKDRKKRLSKKTSRLRSTSFNACGNGNWSQKVFLAGTEEQSLFRGKGILFGQY